WRDSRAIIGGSDAGAHLDLAGSFNYFTRFLDIAVGRQGLLPLEEAVRMVTADPAHLYGLHDRGRLREGSWADVVVFDEAAVGSGTPDVSRRRRDPGARRHRRGRPGGGGGLHRRPLAQRGLRRSSVPQPSALRVRSG